jgi:acetylornithine deacetylase
MKGFLACTLAMAPIFAQASLRRPVHIALTFDEEVGCRGAPLLIAELERAGPRPSAAIVGEPTSMSIVTAHKGCYEYTTTITGLEGHGSAPGRGVNAVELGARFVSKLMALASELEARAPASSPYDPPQTTISVGLIRGGTARNVVAGECVIEWEMRPIATKDASFVLEELAHFERALEAEMHQVSPGAAVTTVTEGAVGGLEDDEFSPAFRLVSRLLGDSQRQVASFGTEAGLYQMAGIPAVVCGPGAIEAAHRPDEHISLDQLERCLDMMKGLVEELSND